MGDQKWFNDDDMQEYRKAVEDEYLRAIQNPSPAQERISFWGATAITVGLIIAVLALIARFTVFVITGG